MKAERAVFTAEFDRPVLWELIIDGLTTHASRKIAGRSAKISVPWDGSADAGTFGREECSVRLAVMTLDGRSLGQDHRLNVNIVNTHDRSIKINQAGYLPNADKRAYVSAPLEAGASFTIHDADSGELRFEGLSDRKSVQDIPAGETVTAVDFSEFRTPGTYYIEVRGLGNSLPFRISEDVYSDVYFKSIRFYYYQRCGTDLAPEYADRWTHKACHLEDAEIISAASSEGVPAGTRIRSIGGWHDAGDLGKKIVPAATAMACLLSLQELFPDRIAAIPLRVPNTVPNQPDILAETRYELEWMLTMQRKDGVVYHLITSPDFAGEGIMPEDDAQKRYFTPVSSCATADFCAVMAIAARLYRPFDPRFAGRCLKAAESGWGYLRKHPEIVPTKGYADPPGINGTGTYGDSDDTQERFWAAAELFRTTGKNEYHRCVKEQISKWAVPFSYPAGWTDPRNWGLLTYVFMEGTAPDSVLQDKLKTAFLAYAEGILRKAGDNGYPSVLSADQYAWGSYSTMLAYADDLIIANRIKPDARYITAALGQLDAALGCNPLDLSFVTGVGTRSVRDPWQAASAWDGIDDPIPGAMPGGPNRYANDPILAEAQKRDRLAPAACFLDMRQSYSCNEVCVTYNAPLVFASGYFAGKER
jgi:endoglucanase